MVSAVAFLLLLALHFAVAALFGAGALGTLLAARGAGPCGAAARAWAGDALGVDLAIERVARRLHRPVESLDPAPPGADHPGLAGFPEGDAFEGWLARLG